MSNPTLPPDVRHWVISFSEIEPKKFTNREVKHCGRIILNLSLVDTDFKKDLDVQLIKMKKIHNYICKYSGYNEVYENPLGEISASSLSQYVFEAPQLLDALLTGCEWADCRYFNGKIVERAFTRKTKAEIKEILELMPQSINCDLGLLKRGMGHVTPLAAACLNEKIDMSIILYLFQKGANPNGVVYCSDRPTHVLKALSRGVGAGKQISDKRWASIVKLFQQFGVDPNYMNIVHPYPEY
jgi:coenzyme F420-reducing hydrogenase delta subunit